MPPLKFSYYFTVAYKLLFIAFTGCVFCPSSAYAEGPKTQEIENKSPEVSNLSDLEKPASALEKAVKKRNAKMQRIQNEANSSYLAIDIDGDGVELTSLWSANAVYWDIDMDGFAEATAWVSPDDGLLAFDRDGDGIINNNDELFGNTSTDGFSILSSFDDNKDGKIDQSDSIWEKLLLWQDKNTDGFSQESELFQIDGSYIISIDLDNILPIQEIKENNKVTRRGQYNVRYAGIDGIDTKTYKIENVIPSYTNTNTIYDDGTPLDFRTLYLPTLRGYPDKVARTLGALCINTPPPKLLGKTLQSLPFYTQKALISVHLPQGAPTSPALANICSWNLDKRLSGLAENMNLTYTRYADDLVFSGGKTLKTQFNFLRKIVEEIALDEGLKVNHSKTRLTTKAQRQSITGIVVNEHLNIAREDYDRLKAILHNCLKYSPSSQNKENHDNFRAYLYGKISYIHSISPDKAQKLLALYEKVDWENKNTAYKE